METLFVSGVVLLMALFFATGTHIGVRMYQARMAKACQDRDYLVVDGYVYYVLTDDTYTQLNALARRCKRVL